MAQRGLTGFEHIVLGLIVARPKSGYDLKAYFTRTPAMVYEPSSGTLYPALRRLESQGLLVSEKETSAGRRSRRVYRATEAGEAVHRDWLMAPVTADTVGRDLGLHLMRFAMAEDILPREAVLTLLTDLGDSLERFIAGMERFAKTVQLPGHHGLMALEHGIAVHRASLQWTQSAIRELSRR